MDNIKEWTSLSKPELSTWAFCRKGWKKISAESSLMPPSPLPTRTVGEGTYARFRETKLMLNTTVPLLLDVVIV